MNSFLRGVEGSFITLLKLCLTVVERFEAKIMFEIKEKAIELVLWMPHSSCFPFEFLNKGHGYPG